MAKLEWDTSSGWDLPLRFDMPSAREIELDLALGSDSWQSLLDSDKPSPAPVVRRSAKRRRSTAPGQSIATPLPRPALRTSPGRRLLPGRPSGRHSKQEEVRR
jgi:hypothetical protein